MYATNESPRKGISKSSDESVDESSVEAVDGSGEKTLK
jgi:hypothetical protein